jgi:hypothetical protein
MRRALTTLELRRSKPTRQEFLLRLRRPITVVLDGVCQIQRRSHLPLGDAFAPVTLCCSGATWLSDAQKRFVGRHKFCCLADWKERQVPFTYRVEIRPLLVATIHRSPHRTMDSIRPTPGTVSPGFAVQTPFGPSKTASPLVTSRTLQPSMMVGLVSGTGARFSRECRSADDVFDLAFGLAARIVATSICS